jgi:hypothetical protein
VTARRSTVTTKETFNATAPPSSDPLDYGSVAITVLSLISRPVDVTNHAADSSPQRTGLG